MSGVSRETDDGDETVGAVRCKSPADRSEWECHSPKTLSWPRLRIGTSLAKAKHRVCINSKRLTFAIYLATVLCSRNLRRKFYNLASLNDCFTLPTDGFDVRR